MPNRNVKRLLACFLLAVFMAPLATHAARLLLPTRELQLGPFTVQAEIAATPQARAQGLMYRESLPPDHGMLFVFARPDMHCFWMKNTPLPLSIAFFDRQGKLISLADMAPHSEASHCPAGPAAYALEMPQGWFNDRGVKPGWKLEGLPGPAAQ